MTNAPEVGSRIIPTLRYRDAPAAIAWLQAAFGFTPRLVVPGDAEGTIEHAQLVRGPLMIMLSTARAQPEAHRRRLPAEVDGANTQTTYVVVDEIDQHYQDAQAAGAEIVDPIRDEDYGGRGYSCRDPEGYLWHFGSYDPWVVEA